MSKFIPAKELKKEYSVYGHFYTVNLNSGDRIDCRSVLEIVKIKLEPHNTDELKNLKSDAVFIMMNPGSSTPKEPVENFISQEKLNKLKISLVPTNPDTTQYQVMRIMHYLDWKHVRVINLSDMRDPQSGSFTERYKELEEKIGFTAHSLFVDDRATELAIKLMRKPDAPIVCAWGVSSELDPLIARCAARISGLTPISGLLKQNSDNKYFHPLPTLQKDKEAWVKNMVSQLRA